MSGPVRFAAPQDGRLDASMCAAWARDGFLVLDEFLADEDCDRLQERAATLASTLDTAAARTVFSTADQRHARDRYFRDSAETIGFFFEERATDQPAAQALNKIGHALHDLDPVFECFSRSEKIKELAVAIGFAQSYLVQSMYIFKQPNIGGEVICHQDQHVHLHGTDGHCRTLVCARGCDDRERLFVGHPRWA